MAAIGVGVMEEVWHGPVYTLPFLYVGTWRRIMFPEAGRDIPFSIENYAYVDRYGRETVTWIRRFQTRRPRRFDAYMIYSERRGRIVDYLGTHQHLAVDIDLSVDPDGGLRLRSGEQRFYEGRIGFRFPPLFSGVADVREWYDEASRRFRIEVRVANSTWAPCSATGDGSRPGGSRSARRECRTTSGRHERRVGSNGWLSRGQACGGSGVGPPPARPSSWRCCSWCGSS